MSSESAPEVTEDVTEVNVSEEQNSWNRIDFGREFISQTLTSSSFSSCAPFLNDCCYDQYLVYGQPFVTYEGYISLILSQDIRLDISANHSIRVSSGHSIASVNRFGQSVGVIHRFGRVFQDMNSHNCCHIESGIHLAKMCSRGLTFTSLNRSLIYLVDNSGCKTTTERFRKLNYDFTSDIFHFNELSGEFARQRAVADVLRASYELSQHGRDQIWHLAGLRVRQKSSGEVIVSKSFGRIAINVSQRKSYLRVITPTLKVTVSDDPQCCLQVVRPHPKNEQRVIASFHTFRVKNGSQKAGFDANDQLVLI